MPRMKRVGRTRDRQQKRSRRTSAWKHNRRLGSAYGGNVVSYIPDHQLPTPLPGEQLPLLIENRPHANDIFPVTGDEVLARIRELPTADTDGLTHVWLRRMKPGQSRPWGSRAYGPGFAVIILYPVPRSLSWNCGERPPGRKLRAFVQKFGASLKLEKREWVIRFTLAGMRRFFLDELVLHEVGHNADLMPQSRANTARRERFAERYADEWAARLRARKKPTGPPLHGVRKARLEELLREVAPYWRPVVVPDVGPTPALTVAFEQFDRAGRRRSNRAWIRPEAIDQLTVDGLRARIARANEEWERPDWRAKKKRTTR